MQKRIYACVIATAFPLQSRLRFRPDLQGKPIAILDGEPPGERVCSVSEAARKLGVTVGMTKAELELYPGVLALPRSYAHESSARAALLECAGCFSPLVEDHSSDLCFLCVLDITGTDTLFGSREVLGEKLRKQVQALCMEASVTASSNFYASVCLARGYFSGERSGVRAVPCGTESYALAPLPLSVLALSQEHTDTFAMWGISTLGELAQLKETELITRLGQQGKTFRLLARGEAPHLFQAIEPGFVLEERMELDVPVELLDSLLFIAGVMLDQLIVRVQLQILSLASITLQLGLEDGTVHTRTVRPALPNNDRQLWLKLAHLDLLAHPPTSAIRSLSLSAEPGSTSKVQMGLFSPQTPEPMRLDVTLARIRSIVGEGCVGSAELDDTHRADAYHLKQFFVPAGAPASSSATESGAQRMAMRQVRPAELGTRHPARATAGGPVLPPATLHRGTRLWALVVGWRLVEAQPVVGGTVGCSNQGTGY